MQTMTFYAQRVLTLSAHLNSCKRQSIQPDQLTLHADRGSSMKSKPVAHLLSDLGIANLAKKVFKTSIGKMIFTSTASVYEEAANRDESFYLPSTFDPSVESINTYQHGKRAAEKEYLDADFPVVTMRIPVVVGLDDYKKRVHWHIAKVMKGEGIYFPDINARYSFILAEDVAKFLFWAGSADLGKGSINAASPDPVKLLDFMKWIEGD